MSALLLCVAFRFVEVISPAPLPRDGVSPVRTMDVRVRKERPRPIVVPRRGARVVAEVSSAYGATDSQPAGCPSVFANGSAHD
jgi:hypothetical protein